jgi:hypothetical protein
MKLKRFIRRKFRRLAFRPDYVRDESLPSFNKKGAPESAFFGLANVWPRSF